MGALHSSLSFAAEPQPVQTCLPFSEPKTLIASKKQTISEMTLPASNIEHYDLLFPIISHFTRNATNRWLTWITETPIDKNILCGYGFDLSKLRVINAKDQTQAALYFLQAIKCETSEAVVVNLDRISDGFKAEANRLVSKNNVRGLVFNYQ